MKVGDLVRLMMGRYLLDSKHYGGQLGVIIGYKYACNHWRVKTMDGMVLLLKSNELELLNESR